MQPNLEQELDLAKKTNKALSQQNAELSLKLATATAVAAQNSEIITQNQATQNEMLELLRQVVEMAGLKQDSANISGEDIKAAIAEFGRWRDPTPVTNIEPPPAN